MLNSDPGTPSRPDSLSALFLGYPDTERETRRDTQVGSNWEDGRRVLEKTGKNKGINKGGPRRREREG